HPHDLHLQHRDRGRSVQPGRGRRGDPRAGDRGHLGRLAVLPPPGGADMSTTIIRGGPQTPAAEPPPGRGRGRGGRRASRPPEPVDDSIPVSYYGLRRGTVTAVAMLCVLFAVFTLIPIAWIVINATKTQANIFET